MNGAYLQGKRILVVEDEFFLAEDLRERLEAVQAEVVGLAPAVADALDIIRNSDHLDGALIDINLRGDMAFSIADALIERSVPFIFTTGYDRSAIPPRFSHIVRCEKPLDLDLAVRTVAKVMEGGGGTTVC